MGYTHPIICQLYQLRKAWRLTQKEIAERSGYSAVCIRRNESGEFSPSIKTVSDWAEVLGYELVLQPKRRD